MEARQEAFNQSPVGADLSARLVARLLDGRLEAAANAKWKDGAASLSTGPMVIVPKWWAGVDAGHPSHYANLWKTGDIALHVADAAGAITQVQSNGVRFKPSDLAAALDRAAQVAPPTSPEPPPAPASTAPSVPAPPAPNHGRHITAAQHATWYSPSQALGAHPKSWPLEVRVRALAERICDGVIKVAAEQVFALDKEDSYLVLPRPTFEDWAFLADEQFWKAGDLLHFMRDRTGFAGYRQYEVKAYNVRLDPDGVHKAAPQTALTGVGPSPALADIDNLPNKGGRPRAEFWDDLIIDTIRRIYEGDWKPRNQAEVVRAM